MKKVIIPVTGLFLAGALSLSAHASAASAQHHMTPQQTKFASCAHQSKGLKRKAHNKFMHACLTGDKKEAARIKAAARAKSDKGGHGHR